MRSKDQILLENLYTKILKESANLEKWNSYSEGEKERIKKYYPWMLPDFTDGLIIRGILKNQVAEAFFREIEKTGNKCLYKVYEIFALDSKDYSDEPDWDKEYLILIEGKGLDGNVYDPLTMARQNKDVNVLTIMNQILYPIKDMSQSYFNGVYENLFRTMAVDDSDPKDKRAYLFTNQNSEYKKPLIEYFGKSGFSVHRQFLTVWSQMIVDRFGDDENLKDENGKMDYSSLLTLGAFAYQ
jgi:hypothetical protein